MPMLKYSVIKVIGQGGFSKVLLVRNKLTGRLYAMKVMGVEMVKDEKKAE